MSLSCNSKQKLNSIIKNPSKSAILTDIDGSISAIVPHPDSAYVDKEVKSLLNNLKKVYSVVGVTTSRGLTKAKSMIGIDGLVYAYCGGLGIMYTDGSYWKAEGVSEEKIKIFLEEVKNKLPIGEGIYLEDKKLTASVHYRHYPGNKEEIKKTLEEEASSFDLSIKPGNKVFEIVPDVNENKGTAVKRIIDKYGIKYFIYFGDDYSDLDVFNLSLQNSICIAVRHKETPQEVMDKANLVVEGVNGVKEIFKYLSK